MNIDRRTFSKSLGGAAAMLALPSRATKANAARLPINRVTRIRTLYPPINGWVFYLRADGSPTHW